MNFRQRFGQRSKDMTPPNRTTVTASRRTLLAVAAASIGAVLLPGCVVVPADGRGVYAGYGVVGGGPVMVAPPPPPGEFIGIAPGPGYFWVGGFWRWNAGRHDWVGGRWETSRQGYQWQPHRWAREGQGWRAEPGYWQRR